jgi:hydrogenase/urease accessory protein HupE
MLLRCGAGLEGRTIGIQYPLYNPAISTLFRFNPSGQATRTAVLPPDRHDWSVPVSTNWKTVARDYFLLGIKHIWEGTDHLMFVLGLLMLARTPRRIAAAVTGFTLAHSLTLSLSTLGLVRVAVPPTEAGIALSILFLAREIARPDPESLARRFPLAISSSFGLLHGFGFAAALRDAGLPRNEIAPALLFFNAGVEAGQLLFIAIVLALIGAMLRASSRIAGSFARIETFGAYALGISSSFWLLERLQAFWAR